MHLVDISPWRRPGIRQNNVLFRFRFQFQVNYLNYNFNQISFNVLPNIDTSTGDRGFRASATFSCLLILFKRLCNPSFWFSNNLSFNFPLFTMTNNLKIRLICGTRGEYTVKCNIIGYPLYRSFSSKRGLQILSAWCYYNVIFLLRRLVTN